MGNTEDQIQIFQRNIRIHRNVGFAAFLTLHTLDFGSKPPCEGYCGFDRTKGYVTINTLPKGGKTIYYRPYLPEFICDIHPSVPQPIIMTNQGLKNISPLCLECANDKECKYCPLTLEARKKIWPEYQPYLNREDRGVLYFIALLNRLIGKNLPQLPQLRLVKLAQGYIPGIGMRIKGFEVLPELTESIVN